MSIEKDYEKLKMIKAEKLRSTRYELYRKNPFEWLRDVLGEDELSYRWSGFGEAYEGHSWDGSKDPLWSAWLLVAKQHARAGVEQKKNWVAVKACTGSSKTYWLARVCLWYLDCYEDSLVVTTAPRGAQLRQNLWAEINKIMHKFKRVRPHCVINKNLNLFAEGDNKSPYCTTKESHKMYGLAVGVGADETSATGAQGIHRKNLLIVCEETAGISSPVMTALQNTCTGDDNIIIAVGNPDSEYDELAKFEQLDNVQTYQISAYDYPNVVLKRDVMSGAVTVGSIDRRLKKYGENSPLFLSRVRGITPKDGDSSLISGLSIDACTVNHELYDTVEVEGHNAVGVDVSNSEDGDKAALAWGRNNVLVNVQEFQCNNATHLAYNLAMDDGDLYNNGYGKMPTDKLIDRKIQPQYIGVDSVGVGIATVNAFLDLGWQPVSLAGGAKEVKEAIPVDKDGTPMWHFNNLRSQMYWELREDIRCRRLVFDIRDPRMMEQIRLELTTPKFALKENAVAIEGKETIKKRLGGKSPNVADAIAYWNWTRKGYSVDTASYYTPSAGE